jgi:MOSC domain-containing protein YiiM
VSANYVDPDTGIRDLEVPQALLRTPGHSDCGIYAVVVEGGEIAARDEVEIR